MVVRFFACRGWDRRSATLFKKQVASRPKTPSTDTTKGVKEARLDSAAAVYLFFFSSSAEERTALTRRLVYDWASVSMTRTSSYATVMVAIHLER